MEHFMTRDGHSMLILENLNKARLLQRSAGKSRRTWSFLKVLHVCGKSDMYLLFSRITSEVKNKNKMYIRAQQKELAY